MVNRIQISSFQNWLSFDKNVWEGAFWNSKNINYRTATQSVELSKWIVDAFSLPWWAGKPVALAYWKNAGTPTTDLVAFTTDGKIITSVGEEGTVANGSIVNIIEANGVKYMIGQQHLYSFTSVWVNTLLKTFTDAVTTRPAVVFWGDIIIWDGNQVLRYNADWTLYEFTSWASTTVIGNLEGTVESLTVIGSSVYVWCNNITNTNLYLWDWVSGDWSEKIVYQDTPVRNVALLANQHYWWSNKSDSSIRQVHLGQWYWVQTYAKSTYPDYPITSEYDSDNNRLALADDSTAHTNAIETIADLVYLPWIGSIYSFGKYYPFQNPSICREYTFTGTYVYCMTSGGTTASGYDVGGVLAFGCLDGSTYKIKIINLWADWLPWLWVTYASEWEIETLEFKSPSFAISENNIKTIVPFYLPHSSTTIEVYAKLNQWSYTLIKTIASTEYGTGFNTAEIKHSGKWATIQFKFKLKTSNTNYTPKLYLGITNESETAWSKL